MVEITTVTIASAAERIAATSSLWGQTSTAPIFERRFLLTDLLVKDASANVGIGLTAPAQRLNISGGFQMEAATATLPAAVGGVFLISNESPVKRLYFGDGTGYSIAFSKRAASATTDMLTLTDAGNLTLASPLGAFGYGTGAGGAVTQGTSRTTGVTLSKPCGAITLVSAAGSTTFQSFTVTNTLVAATDTIRIVQKSGTDKYAIWITNVAAGSFQVTFATLSGTTTEQPVFNFAIERAVTA